MPRLTVSQVADGMHLASTGLANWILAEADGQVTLVDAGYPRDGERVRASLAAIGRTPGDVAAVLLTHAHVDHLGGIAGSGVTAPVLSSEAEAAHARREYLQQATEKDVLLRAWRPRVLLWSLQIAALGATKDVSVPTAAACRLGVPLDLPGRPVAVPTPGHTTGHTAYHFAAAGAVASGDALVTAHPVTGVRRPHLLPTFFSHAPEQMDEALDNIAALDADTLLPGHGPAWRGTMADAVALARS
ncbi:MBL fold metallo-hydrolase [Nocardioides montaniterrae]